MRQRRIRDKRDRVRQLRIFCEVVRAGSISGAAERLALTQPAVSIQVRELEHMVGAILFERDSRGALPTTAGERLHALAAPLVEGVDTLFDDVHRSLGAVHAGQVRLATSNAGASFVLPPYVKRFREHHPDIPVSFETVGPHEGLDRLLDERVDLVCGAKDSYREESVRYDELFTYGFVLITALGHPLAGRERVSPHEASSYRAIVPPEGSYSRQFGERTARELGVVVDAAVEVGGWGEVKRFVEFGVGISVVPSLCVTKTDQLEIIKLDAPLPRRSYGVFTPRRRLLTPAARRFYEVLVPDAPEFTPPPPPPRGAAPRRR